MDFSNLKDVLEPYFDVVKDEVLADIKDIMPDVTLCHFTRLVDYNVKGGKMNRALFVLTTALTIRGDSIAPDQLKKLCIIGVCIEWVLKSYMVPFV